MLTAGKDFEYVRYEFDIPRLNALNACNSKTPPTHIGVQRLCRMVEAFMGIEDDSHVDQYESDLDDDHDLMADLYNFPQGG